MNEQELNKKLAEWAGLCWHDWEWTPIEYHDSYEARCKKCGVSQYGVTQYGKDTERGFGYDRPNFVHSFDTCRNILIPKLLQIRIEIWNGGTSKPRNDVEVWDRNRYVEGKVGMAAQDDQLPLALCLAIEQLIDHPT